MVSLALLFILYRDIYIYICASFYYIRHSQNGLFDLFFYLQKALSIHEKSKVIELDVTPNNHQQLVHIYIYIYSEFRLYLFSSVHVYVYLSFIIIFIFILKAMHHKTWVFHVLVPARDLFPIYIYSWSDEKKYPFVLPHWWEISSDTTWIAPIKPQYLYTYIIKSTMLRHMCVAGTTEKHPYIYYISHSSS